MNGDVKKLVTGGISAAALISLIGGGWTLYDKVKAHVIERQALMDRVEALEEADCYNRLADAEMWLCDLDPAMKWYRGDCIPDE
jgi:hypothetical protein